MDGNAHLSHEDHREKLAGARFKDLCSRIVGAMTGFVSNGSLEEVEVVPDIGAAGPKGLRFAIDNEMKV